MRTRFHASIGDSTNRRGNTATAIHTASCIERSARRAPRKRCAASARVPSISEVNAMYVQRSNTADDGKRAVHLHVRW